MEINALQRARLYGILDLGYVEAANAEQTVRAMLKGGVEIVQLRAKDHTASDILALARRIAPICRESGVPLILNDHPALVPECGADGVHVGQDDISVNEARALAGPGKIVGKSTHSIAQAVAAMAERPDYIGFGPLFATPTKPDYTPIGTQDIKEVHRLVSLPIFCIGGIKRENLATVYAAGSRRVVIVSGILAATDILGYCRDCRTLLASQ